MSILSHGQARRIASEWHGGQATALYALASSGYRDEAAEGEIEREIATVRRQPGDHPANADLELRCLHKYVRTQGFRTYVGLPWCDRWDETPATENEATCPVESAAGVRAHLEWITRRWGQKKMNDMARGMLEARRFEHDEESRMWAREVYSLSHLETCVVQLTYGEAQTDPHTVRAYRQGDPTDVWSRTSTDHAEILAWAVVLADRPAF